MKIPEPMIPPITTIVASNGPRARLKVTPGDYTEPRLEYAEDL